MGRRAIYPGSFDPFTNGHLDIVKKASALFDEVDIVIGIKSSTRRSFDATEVENAILETLKLNGITNCRVCTHEGLVAAFAKDNNIRYMIRGLRNNMDYNYEENIAEVNKLINPTWSISTSGRKMWRCPRPWSRSCTCTTRISRNLYPSPCWML